MLEKGVLGETHTVGASLVYWWSHLMGIFNLILPVVEGFLLGLLSGIKGFNDPDLVTISLDRSLYDGLILLSVHTHSQASMSLNQVSLVGKGAVGNSGHLEPAAVMLAGIGDDLSVDIRLVLEDAKGMGAFLVSKGQLTSLRENVEVLVGLVVMFIQDKLALFVNCENEVLVQNGVYFVETLLVHINLWVYIRVFRLLRFLLWPLGSLLLLVLSLVVLSTFLFLFLIFNSLNPPELILIRMNVVLQDLFAVLSLSSRNIENFASMSLDEVSLIGPFSFFSSGKSEPAACMSS